MQVYCSNYFIKLQKVSERVAKSINEAPFSKSDIAKKMDVSYHTILRWSKQEKEDYKDSEIRKLSENLRVSYDWLMFGEGSMSDDPDISQIEQRVNEQGESYKGLDQTLLDVESKANSLIHDLESLVRDLKKIRSDD